MSRFHTKRRHGFALITALGVLVLLMIMAFGAASTVQFTYGFSSARQSDRMRADILSSAAELLLIKGVPEPGSATVEVMTGRTLARNDVQVSATVQQPEIGRQLLGTALSLRDGDRVVELSAAAAPSNRISRTAVYLLNSKGMRNAPILLLERRQ